MIGAPFAAWFGLLNAGFPLRSDVRTRVGAQPTQGLPERSGGLGGFAESWRLGSRGRMRAKKGETKSKLLLGWNGTQWNEGEALLNKGARELARETQTSKIERESFSLNYEHR